MALTRAATLSTALVTSEAVVDRFSTNAICRQHNCVNPIFPGLQDLDQLQAAKWTCPDPDSRPELKAVHHGGRSWQSAIIDWMSG
eukprot:Skav200967  [mRNA]  locus=scaffold448:579771:582853:- [translate_table: standard]